MLLIAVNAFSHPRPFLWNVFLSYESILQWRESVNLMEIWRPCEVFNGNNTWLDAVFQNGKSTLSPPFFCHLMTHVNGASFVQWPNVIRTFPSFSYSFFISVVCFMLYIWMLKCQWLLEWVSCRETAQFKCRWTVQQTAAADPSQLHLYIQKPSRKRERETVSQSVGE